MAKAPSLRGLKPMHPGEFLRDIILPEVAHTKVEIADMLGISRNHLYGLLNGAVSVEPALAFRLGKMFGNGPEFWLNLQKNYDLAVYEPVMAKDIAKIPTLTAA